MHIGSKEYASGLTHLDMIDGEGYSLGLIHVTEIDSPKVSNHQRLSLEKARKVGASAIYFRNFPDSNRPAKPQLYIFDFTAGVKNVVEIHKNVWSSSEVRLYIIITKIEIKFYNSSKPAEHTKDGNLQVEPFETLKLVGHAIKEYKKFSGKRFDNGSFWEKTNIDFGYSQTAYEKLITELKNTRDKFLKQIKL